MDPTIIVYANCQGQAILRFLERHPSLKNYRFVHLRAWLGERPDAEQLAACRLFVYQKSFGMPSFIDELPVATGKICIPLLNCSYLWPHTFDRPEEDVGWRFPYGDRFLIGKIKMGATPDDAVQAYLNLDLGKRLNIERLYQMETEKWRLADNQSDVPLSDFLLANAPYRRLFLTPDHPTDQVIIRLVNGILGLWGVPALAEPDWADHAHSLQGVEVPIHPAIVRHFRLDYLPDDYRYPLWGGWLGLNAADTYRRYSRALCAPSFDEGLAEAAQDILDGKLDSALNICSLVRLRRPDHPQALATLAVAMALMGQRDQSVGFLRQAFRAHPPTGGPGA